MDNEENEKEHMPSIKIKVMFFARARDLTGMTETSLEVSPGTTAHDCLNKLISKFPGLEEIHKCLVLALNEEYAPESAVVKDGDELAIIPPISGVAYCIGYISIELLVHGLKRSRLWSPNSATVIKSSQILQNGSACDL